ncbi:MAG: signal peptidase I [Caldisericia bacterium]|nr:signal peptidase I [Caldisericia bacterium]
MKLSPTVKKEIIEWIWTIAVALLIAFLVRQFLFQPYKVEMGSMTPTLHEGDYVIVNKLYGEPETIERGNIVVFRPPSNKLVSYIKRVVGLPGETVEVKNGCVKINGEEILEEYVSTATPNSFGPEVLKENEYFVMGDHRNNSLDSRDFGPIQADTVDGRAVLIIWPIKDFKSLSHVEY